MSFAPPHFAVWSEIPVTDLDRAMEFYSSVFDIALSKDDTGPNPIAMFPTADGMGVAGHLYPGTPAGDGRGPTVHFACPDSLEATMNRVWSAGGKVLSDPIAIPVGSFFYAQDPDGNSIGIFQYAPQDGE